MRCKWGLTGGGHLTIIVGTGGWAFANKNCPQSRAFHNFFKCPGFAGGEVIAAGIGSHITRDRPATEFSRACTNFVTV